jgi:hypothetical protein
MLIEQQLEKFFTKIAATDNGDIGFKQFFEHATSPYFEAPNNTTKDTNPTASPGRPAPAMQNCKARWAGRNGGRSLHKGF